MGSCYTAGAPVAMHCKSCDTDTRLRANNARAQSRRRRGGQSTGAPRRVGRADRERRAESRCRCGRVPAQMWRDRRIDATHAARGGGGLGARRHDHFGCAEDVIVVQRIPARLRACAACGVRAAAWRSVVAHVARAMRRLTCVADRSPVGDEAHDSPRRRLVGRLLVADRRLQTTDSPAGRSHSPLWGSPESTGGSAS